MDLANTLSYASIVSFCIAGVLLVAAIFQWFKFNIWEIINDLSGRTARKEIEQMRATNEKSGLKGYRPSPMNVDRGKITDAIGTEEKTEGFGRKQVKHITNKLLSRKSTLTDALGTNQLEKPELELEKSNHIVTSETGHNTSFGTEVLKSEVDISATDVLARGYKPKGPYNETTVLQHDFESQVFSEQEDDYENGNFKILDSKTIIHTEEVIQ